MEAKQLVHMERSGSSAVCGASKVATTATRADVTCRVCCALLDDDGWSVGEERVVQRGAHELEARDVVAMVAATAEERWRWHSLEAAERQYVRIVDDGTPIRSSWASEAPVQGTAPSSRSSGREEVIAMDVALARAFAKTRFVRGVEVSPREQRAIYELARFGRIETVPTGPGRKGRITKRVSMTATEIAAVTRACLTPHEVGLIVRSGRAAVRAELERAGVLRPEKEKATNGAEDAMAMPKGWKGYEGWKEIADALGVATSTAEDLSLRAENPLPVVRYIGRIILREEEMLAWQEREIERGKAEQERRRSMRPRKVVVDTSEQLAFTGLDEPAANEPHAHETPGIVGPRR